MAKSSRSKWKKLHRRQKAKEESTNTVKRIKQLHRKLELTAKGGISAVPPQEPERRFHFLNPELDPRVPNTRKDLNNNYRAELNHVHYDYTKPLKLTPPKTNLYGKTDVTAPHPMTQNYLTIDADAPIGGHALTKADMERLVRKSMAQEAETAAATAAAANEESMSESEASGSEDGPEEYVFGMDDSAPRRAGAGASSAVATAKKATKKASGAAAGKADKITSMQAGHKKNGVTVAAGGDAKMKKVGSKAGVSGARLVSSGGKAAQKKTANAKAVVKAVAKK